MNFLEIYLDMGKSGDIMYSPGSETRATNNVAFYGFVPSLALQAELALYYPPQTFHKTTTRTFAYVLQSETDGALILFPWKGAVSTIPVTLESEVALISLIYLMTFKFPLRYRNWFLVIGLCSPSLTFMLL